MTPHSPITACYDQPGRAFYAAPNVKREITLFIRIVPSQYRQVMNDYGQDFSRKSSQLQDFLWQLLSRRQVKGLDSLGNLKMDFGRS